VVFRERELCVLHYVGPDSYLTLLYWSSTLWRTGYMCTCITFCWIRQLVNATLIGPVAFGGRELCVPILHSAGPDSYLTLL
jgi:hypothetical protein